MWSLSGDAYGGWIPSCLQMMVGVFINLFSNEIQAIPDRGKIKVRAEIEKGLVRIGFLP